MNSVKIKHLDPAISADEVRQRFSHYGPVVGVHFNRKEEGLARDEAVVEFDGSVEKGALHRCVSQLSGTVWKGNKIRVRLKNSSKTADSTDAKMTTEKSEKMAPTGVPSQMNVTCHLLRQIPQIIRYDPTKEEHRKYQLSDNGSVEQADSGDVEAMEAVKSSLRVFKRARSLGRAASTSVQEESRTGPNKEQPANTSLVELGQSTSVTFGNFLDEADEQEAEPMSRANETTDGQPTWKAALERQAAAEEADWTYAPDDHDSKFKSEPASGDLFRPAAGPFFLDMSPDSMAEMGASAKAWSLNGPTSRQRAAKGKVNQEHSTRDHLYRESKRRIKRARRVEKSLKKARGQQASSSGAKTTKLKFWNSFKQAPHKR